MGVDDKLVSSLLAISKRSKRKVAALFDNKSNNPTTPLRFYGTMHQIAKPYACSK
jgi:hypothetical protein